MAFFEKLHIEGCRGICGLDIDDLKRVNLIVGDNNSGKTSVLEALQLLRTSGTLSNVYRVARQRTSISGFNTDSTFDSFICMFPRNNNKEMVITVSGVCNDKEISFDLRGHLSRVLLDGSDMGWARAKGATITDDIETDEFDGVITIGYDGANKKTGIRVNQYSKVTGMLSSKDDMFSIVYVSPFEHLKGRVINRVLKDKSYKQICIRALQLFDPDIEDMMILTSDAGDRPVEYISHKRFGVMPISSYGDGIKKVLALSNAIAFAADGVLLIDEIETAIHKKYYDDIFNLIVKACKSFNVQVFITTHSIEAIDGLLATQEYENQAENDDICVCTLKKDENRTFSRVLSGREVYENRDAFGFEVRL